MQHLTDHINYEIFIFSDQVVYTRYFDKCEITLEVILELKKKTLEALEHKPYFSFVDFKFMYGDFSAEAKEVVSNDPDLIRLKKAEVLMCSSLPVKLLIKFYLKFNKPKMPTKGFQKDIEGVNFLKKHGASDKGLKELLNYLKKERTVTEK